MPATTTSQKASSSLNEKLGHTNYKLTTMTLMMYSNDAVVAVVVFSRPKSQWLSMANRNQWNLIGNQSESNTEHL